MTKTSFILSQPATLPAKQVVALGKKQGVKLTVGYVHSVRWMARKSAPPRVRLIEDVRLGGLNSSPPRNVVDATMKIFGLYPVARKSARGSDPNSAESKLRHLFGEVGLIRSREIVASIERSFA